jgi:hypothetical protein
LEVFWHGRKASFGEKSSEPHGVATLLLHGGLG